MSVIAMACKGCDRTEEITASGSVRRLRLNPDGRCAACVSAEAETRPSLREVRDVSGLTLRDRDLMQLLDLRPTQFYAKKRAHLYDFLMVSPQLTGYTEYSGTLVQRWRDGAGTAPAFGQRRFKLAR